MKRFLLPVLIGLLYFPVFGQAFSGSVFSSFSYSKTDKALETFLGKESFGSDYGARLNFYAGDEAGEASARLGFLLSLQENGALNYSWELYEAFASVSAGDYLRFIAGRQVLPLGVCYAVHPVDYLNISLGDETKGRDGLSIRWAIGADYSGAFMLLTDSAYGAGFDPVSDFGYAGFFDAFIADSLELGLSAVLLKDRNGRLGGWFSFPVDPFVFSSELAWDKKEEAWLGALSSEWDFYGQWSSLVVILEAVYQQKQVMRDYSKGVLILSHIEWTVWDMYVFKESAIWEFADNSAMIALGMGFLPGEKTECSLDISLPIGKEDSFYGAIPYDFAGELKVSISF